MLFSHDIFSQGASLDRFADCGSFRGILGRLRARVPATSFANVPKGTWVRSLSRLNSALLYVWGASSVSLHHLEAHESVSKALRASLSALFGRLGALLRGLRPLQGGSWEALVRARGDLNATPKAINVAIEFCIDFRAWKGAGRTPMGSPLEPQNRSEMRPKTRSKFELAKMTSWWHIQVDFGRFRRVPGGRFRCFSIGFPTIF